MKRMHGVGGRLMILMTGLVGLSSLTLAQPKLIAGNPAAGQLPMKLQTKQWRMYRWETSQNLSTWGGPPASASQLPLLASGSSMNLNVPIGQPKEFFRVKETVPFEPAWSGVKPLRVIQHAYNPLIDAIGNGAALKTAISALVPGDRLEIATGLYRFQPRTSLTLQGTAAAPIWISAAPSAQVVLTRPDALQNLLELGVDAPMRYVAFEGIEFTGGSTGMRLGNCSQLWINRCQLHDFDSAAISANSVSTSYLFITGNEISRTADGGDGISVGSNDGLVIANNCVFALNHIHHTFGDSLGEGIEIKRGSWGNLVSGNLVHDTAASGIFLGVGSALGPNIVENNVCYASGDYALRVTSHCVVRNNLSFGGVADAFACVSAVGGDPTNVSVVHNTFVSPVIAARLSGWATGSNFVFANNACYSQSGNSITVSGGTGTAVFAGLVTFGPVSSGIPVAAVGTGLGDFVNVSWNGTTRDAASSAASPLRNAASAAYLNEYDINYFPRLLPTSVGSYR